LCHFEKVKVMAGSYFAKMPFQIPTGWKRDANLIELGDWVGFLHSHMVSYNYWVGGGLKREEITFHFRQTSQLTFITGVYTPVVFP